MKRLVFALTLALFCWTVNAQEKKLPVFITDSLNNYIVKGMNDWKIPGLAVAIVKDGKVVYINGFGTTRMGGPESVDENTLFMIGSNTKAFTSTTLSILQAAGKLNLNDKVKKWMPEFQLKDSLASHEINIIDLLSHRIGFETFQGDFTYWSSNLSRAEVIRKMRFIDAPYGFRTKWGYCNAAFLTAGELIPRITGKSWEQTVKDSILIPLKMNRTLMLANDLKKSTNVAQPYTIVDNQLIEIPIPQIDNLAPAASMSSSAKDMTSWLLAQLNEGKLNGQQLIPAMAIRNIRTPASIMGIDPRDHKFSHFRLYGLGLAIGDRDGKLMYSHTGAVDGFLSSVMFLPEEKLGIVVLTNTDQNNFFQNLTDEIRDAFLELPYQGFSYQSLEQFKKRNQLANDKMDTIKNMIKRHNKPALPINSYTGKYQNPVYGWIEIKLENDLLNIHFSNHPDLIGKLEHIQNDNYLCTYSNPTMGIVEIPFTIKDGVVTGLTLRVADFLEFTPYQFSKVSQ
ncbi:MAG TPA: serine hydrolase [Prolixibacteraceae bacterium]|jgi:CubicO group peptidase (beta-lactamase class C family)